MADANDERRITDAFATFHAGMMPAVRPAGVDAVRDTVRRRRRVAAVAAVVALVIATPTIAIAAIGDRPEVSPQPGVSVSPHRTPAPPSPSPSPTASPSLQNPSPPPASDPSGGNEVEQPPAVTGTPIYLDLSGRLYVGDQQYPGGEMPSVNVSPDGTRVTWVDSFGTGDLLMSDLDGSDQRVIHHQVDGSCVEPVWSGDSTRLLFSSHTGTSSVRILYLGGGAGDHLGEPLGCHYRWSANGERIAYLHGDLSAVTVTDLNGGRKVTLSREVLGEGRMFTDLATISAEGGRVCVATDAAGGPGGDVARNLHCDTVIDVARQQVIDLPVAGQLLTVLFQSDGGMLVRVDTGQGRQLVLLDADGQVVARSAEPAAHAERMLLAYTPGQG